MNLLLTAHSLDFRILEVKFLQVSATASMSHSFAHLAQCAHNLHLEFNVDVGTNIDGVSQAQPRKKVR